MFEIDLVETCGGIMSLALEESLGKGTVLIIGPNTKSMKFLDWKPKTLKEPMKLTDAGEYDFIVCIQCLDQLRGVKLINIDNKIYGVDNNTKLVDLTKEQSRQANAFMKKTNLKLHRGLSAILPLELHTFLGKAEKALKHNGKLVFIDSGPMGLFENLSMMQVKQIPLSRFLASTTAGKMHVVNCQPLLANSPHLIRDSSILTILKRFNYENKLVPWLDLVKKLSSEEKDAVEPFMTKVSSVFSGWGGIVSDYRASAKSIKRSLSDVEGLTELYSSLFVLNGAVSTDFNEKAWLRANEIVNLPSHPDFFAATLTKSI